MFDMQVKPKLAQLIRIALGTVAVGALLIPLAACETEGVGDRAADENRQSSGWQDRGRDPGSFQASGGAGSGSDGRVGQGGFSSVWTYALSYSDLILTPDGKYVLMSLPVPGPDEGWAEPALALAVQPVSGGAPIVFPDVLNLRRINFAPDGSVAWLLGQDGRSIRALDLDLMEVHPVALELPGQAGALDVSPSGRFVIGSDIPTTDLEEFIGLGACSAPTAPECTLSILDTWTGQVRTHFTANPVRDLDFSPMGDELLVTHSTWVNNTDPVTTLSFVDPLTGISQTDLTFPNCADELVITPAGLGLLGPLRCRRDPISVIDLQSRSFVKNLPGFGPVSVSQDGSRAVGFTRKADMLQDWGIQQTAEVGLIIIDLPELTWSLVEFGEREPSYLMSPNGQWIYTYLDAAHSCKWVESINQQWEMDCHSLPPSLSRLEVATATWTKVSGPDLRLRHFGSSPDLQTLLVVDQGILATLQMGSAELNVVPTLGFAPSLINTSVDGGTTVLGQRDSTALMVFPWGDWAQPTLLAPAIQ
ncbi:MAG: hypothetical protein ACI9WU_000592 [Myxococcota bacterium]|jgi:hypothetical protein